MANALRMQGKTALITGGGFGIGRAIALRLAWEGAKIAVLDWNLSFAEETAKLIRQKGGEAIAVQADIRLQDEIQTALNKIHQQLGMVDILINNAGGMPSTLSGNRFENELLHRTTEESLRLVVDVNLIGTLLMCQIVLGDMLEKEKGKIINIASVAGVNGIPRFTSYSASKGGVIAMTKALAMEVGNRGINVNCVSPGSIYTHGGSPVTFLNRSGQPEEVASLVAFLASEESDFITGCNYFIDGGRSISMRCYDVQ